MRTFMTAMFAGLISIATSANAQQVKEGLWHFMVPGKKIIASPQKRSLYRVCFTAGQQYQKLTIRDTSAPAVALGEILPGSCTDIKVEQRLEIEFTQSTSGAQVNGAYQFLAFMP